MINNCIHATVLLVCSVSSAVAVAADAAEDHREKLTLAATENRSRLHFDGENFSGPAWETLLAAARDADFFLIGEEHGIAENPKLASQLFTSLTDNGYRKLVIEISPSMARIVDQTLYDEGLEGLRLLFAEPGGEPAFFGMREEAEMLAAVRAALPDETEVFWGVDYEVAGDRTLLRELQAASPPDSARQALEALNDASAASWSRYEETGGPQFIFSFAGDPVLVRAVRDVWPHASGHVEEILDTLETTLEINQRWMQGKGWESNALRAAFLRSNFLQHWRDAAQNGAPPKVMAKLGASHLVRGRNSNGTFDLGTLLPEIAATKGGRSVSVLVLPGQGSLTAVLNPSTWSFESKPAKDNYAGGIEPITAAALDDAFTLIDLAPLRSIVGTKETLFGSQMLQVVHGFDLLLVMSGSTASGEFAHN